MKKLMFVGVVAISLFMGQESAKACGNVVAVVQNQVVGVVVPTNAVLVNPFNNVVVVNANRVNRVRARVVVGANRARVNVRVRGRR